MIVWFDEIAAAGTGHVGGKGANLGECADAGLPVPPGFCVTTDAYREATRACSDVLTDAAARGDAATARECILALPFPQATRDAIGEAYTRLGAGPVAVRSSATAEDLAEASFAGQQDSYLGVVGVDAVLDAVRRCWASLWTDRAVDYRRRQGIDDEGLALAVVVQKMVASQLAGVLFTRDPVTGDDATMLVSSSYGLGESVVAALVTPDTFTISRRPPAVVTRQIGTKLTRIDMTPDGGTTSCGVPADDRARPSLTDAQLLRLAELGERVEDHYGTGQDIEWAFAGDDLYLLQARPITTTPAVVQGHPPVKGRIQRLLRDDLIEHFPAPFPLDLVAGNSIEAGAMKAFGLPPTPSMVKGDEDGIIRVVPGKLRIPAAAVLGLPRTIRSGVRHDPFCWPDEEQTIRHRLSTLAAIAEDAVHLPDRELLGLVRKTIAEAEDVTSLRFSRWLAPMMLNRLVAILLMKLSRAGRAMTPEDLYAGVPYKTAEINAAIMRLVSDAREYDVADAIVSAPQGKVGEALAAHANGPDFEADVAEFLAAHGARTARLYLPFSNRSWREDPETFYALLAAALRGTPPTRPQADDAAETVARQLPRFLQRRWRAQADDAAETIARQLPRFLRRRWRANTARLRARHIGREGTVYLIEEFFCLAREGMDEIARRLVERHQLDEARDIRFLYFEEVENGLLSGFQEGESGQDTSRRVGGLNDLRDAEDRPSRLREVGNGLGDPRLGLQPTVTRRRHKRSMAEAIWWDRGESNETASREGVLRGLAASAGRASGKARVIYSPDDFARLQPGEILVCPYTDPTWTPLFALAAGVVADSGGPLSHAAIVAREYGIPAVLGTGSATTSLPDGARLMVDGSAGTVALTDPVAS